MRMYEIPGSLVYVRVVEERRKMVVDTSSPVEHNAINLRRVVHVLLQSCSSLPLSLYCCKRVRPITSNFAYHDGIIVARARIHVSHDGNL